MTTISTATDRPQPIIEPSEPTTDRLPAPLWRTGFRPFYLLASLHAFVTMGAWLMQWSGITLAGHPGLPLGAIGHAQEMVFGFCLAVIAGFLLTAVPNWTATAPVSGTPLQALVLIWVAARICVWSGWTGASVVFNAAFPVALAMVIGVALIRTANRRNLFFLLLLVALALTAATASGMWGGTDLQARRGGIWLGLDIILFIVCVIAGRVIPMFTKNGVPGTQPQRRPWLERACPASILLLTALDAAAIALVPAGSPVGTVVVVPVAVVSATAAVLHAWRLALWQTARTLGSPIVWILHVGYGWIAVHLLLRSLHALGWVPAPAAIHALTVGVIGVMTIGMMTRTARGHTARPLKAGRTEVAAYWLVCIAAVVRVVGALLDSPSLPGTWAATAGTHATVTAGLAWMAAYALYALRYWSFLTRPRLDGGTG